MKRPTDDQMNTAVLWLDNNEGDEAADCKAVARWLDEQIANHELRQTAREGGVRVAALRRKLKELAKDDQP